MKRKLIAVLIATMTISSVQPALAMEGTTQQPAEEVTVQEEDDTSTAAEETSEETDNAENGDAEASEAAETAETDEVSDAAETADAAEEKEAEDAGETADPAETEDYSETEETTDETDVTEEETIASEQETEADKTENPSTEEAEDVKEAEEDLSTEDESPENPESAEASDQTSDMEEAQDAAVSEAMEDMKKVQEEVEADAVKEEAQEGAVLTQAPFKYKIVSGAVSIVGYTEETKNVVIPKTLDGYNVISIESSAFKGNTSITTLSFQGNVREIGTTAFSGCTSLKSVTLPDSLLSLGNHAFKNTAISSIVIPAKLEKTGYYSPFEDCPELTSVTFAAGMKTIPNKILWNASSVRSLTIPDSITEIGNYALSGTGITEFKGHNNITGIGNNAFMNCASLNTVQLPSGLRSIGNHAFKNTAISSIVIPANLEKTEYYSPFEDCPELTSVTFATGIKTIPTKTLWNAKYVKTVTIPVSVKNINNYAFNGCSNLETVCFNGAKADWDRISIGIHNEPLTNAKLVTLRDNKITASNCICSYSQKARTISLGAKALAGKLRYSSSNSGVKVDGNGNVTIKAKFSGSAKITISTSGDDKYAGTSKVISVTVPKRPSISGLKSKKAGRMTVKWSKKNSCTGYQIQYSRKSSFKSRKTVTISKKSTTARTIKGLKKGKRYYVRVRAFNTVNGKKYYSNWSTAKKVKIRK